MCVDWESRKVRFTNVRHLILVLFLRSTQLNNDQDIQHALLKLFIEACQWKTKRGQIVIFH